MLSLQNYGSSSETDSDTENVDKTLEPHNAHLKPIDPSNSVASTLAIQAAPEVVAIVSIPFDLRQFQSKINANNKLNLNLSRAPVLWRVQSTLPPKN